MKKKNGFRITKEQVLCLLAGLFLSVCASVTGERTLYTDAGGNTYVNRPEAGETGKEIEITASYGEIREKISVGISPRAFTETEAEAMFLSAMNRIPEILRGENESLLTVKKSLQFPASFAELPGLHCSFSPSDRSVITEEGEVRNETITEEISLEILVVLTAGDFRREYYIPVKVCPAEEEVLSDHDRLGKLLLESDQTSPEEGKVLLPSEVNGKKVTYAVGKNPAPLLLFFLGVLSAGLLSLKPKEEERERKKKRETELAIDYSEVVSKLIVYIGAGLTIRNAWSKLSEGQEGETHAVYQEILFTDNELKNGVPESKAYMDFGRRCGLKCYLRLSSLLDQNRKTGDSALLSALELEMEEAFEQRKNTARRLGEEAGTKLMLPLMMSLITVLIIVLVPAVMKMM